MQAEEDPRDHDSLRDADTTLYKYTSPFGRNLWTGVTDASLDWRVVGSRPSISDNRSFLYSTLDESLLNSPKKHSINEMKELVDFKSENQQFENDNILNASTEISAEENKSEHGNNNFSTPGQSSVNNFLVFDSSMVFGTQDQSMTRFGCIDEDSLSLSLEMELESDSLGNTFNIEADESSACVFSDDQMKKYAQSFDSSLNTGYKFHDCGTEEALLTPPFVFENSHSNDLDPTAQKIHNLPGYDINRDIGKRYCNNEQNKEDEQSVFSDLSTYGTSFHKMHQGFSNQSHSENIYNPWKSTTSKIFSSQGNISSNDIVNNPAHFYCNERNTASENCLYNDTPNKTPSFQTKSSSIKKGLPQDPITPDKVINKTSHTLDFSDSSLRKYSLGNHFFNVEDPLIKNPNSKNLSDSCLRKYSLGNNNDNIRESLYKDNSSSHFLESHMRKNSQNSSTSNSQDATSKDAPQKRFANLQFKKHSLAGIASNVEDSLLRESNSTSRKFSGSLKPQHDEPLFGDAFHLTISKKFSNMDVEQIVLWLGEPLYLVQFYSGRLDIAYCTDGTKEVGQFVILEADRGEDCGQVVATTQKERYHALLAKLKDIPHEVVPKRIHRAALRKDIHAMLRKQQSEEEALRSCRQRVAEVGLPMEIVGCEYQWDMKKLTFFFVSRQRVDFRDLVRDLFQTYQVRIWMCAIEKSKNSHLRHLMD